jgi:hypothetical protein
MLRGFLIGVIAAMLGLTSASAAVRIDGDPGGQIGSYLVQFLMLRDSGQQVIIDGPCMSACTLVLSMIPRDRICVTKRAQLGFHAAWTPDLSGRPLTSFAATRILFETYPPKVKKWIKRNGGLSPRTILLRGRELGAMYQPCG